MITHVVCFPKPIGLTPELAVKTWNLRFFSQEEHGFRFPRRLTRGGRIFMCSDSSSHSSNVPVLSSYEVVGRLRLAREGKAFLAMYSSVVGGITTDPAAMVLPLDDHMVHRGHGVFDTAMIVNGYLYELDQHLDRILRSASMAKIPLPFDREKIRRILIQTVSVSGCRNGSLRYWLSAGPGDFLLSPSQCLGPALYAIVFKKIPTIESTGVKVVTSSIPIKPPEFATVKSVNYLPNALSQLEAEAKGAFAGIWVDDNGFIAEGPNMNVAFVVNGGKELVMPRFDNILSGCTAKRTITLAEKLVSKGMLKSVKVMDVTVEDGKKADEMMLLGSGVLIQPVIQWDEELIGDGKEAPIAKALLELLLEDMSSGPPSVRVLEPLGLLGLMKIRVKQATIVKPAEETPNHSLWLSNLDLIQVRFHMGILYFYNPCSSSNLPNIQSLIEALSKVLVLFYPAAGRLQKDKNGRLEVRCNGEGVLLVEAETDSTIQDIGLLAQRLDLSQLVPTLDYSQDISTIPLLLFQVTYFKCGTICIGNTIHHTFGAAASLVYFMEAWSRTARGLPVKLEPFFDRTILRARDPPSPVFPHTEYQPPPFHNPPVESLVYRSNPESDSAVASLKLTRLQLKALRAKAKIADSSKFSTYEVLVAHIWRCACFANEDLTEEHSTRLHIIVDGRSRLRPTLPQGYIGNTLFHARPISLLGDFRRERFSTTVKRVHREIRKMDNEYLRSAIDYLEKHPDLDQLVPGEGNPIFSCAANMCIVSIPRKNAFELDFGWGSPFYKRASHLNEGKGFVDTSLDEEGSFLVFMCLKKRQLGKFQKLFYEFLNVSAL
ncbi:unnamed protein product [Arabis nemorensis]|uniref:Uncharacterized protein n=1 Tax=Arabis nemorensis TaxID=586526 RepID=A0A565CS15_9BRAS|nr:unnamed protein product [Arabis nemorensis]